MKRGLVVLALAIAALGAGTAARAEQSSPPIVVTFEKHLVDPANLIFKGTTDGDVTGVLVSRMVPGSLTIEGPIWHFTFDWIVGATPRHQSFVARTAGTFDTATGRVILDGTVIVGWHRGSAVHEEGRLVDPATFTFAGRIEIARDSDD